MHKMTNESIITNLKAINELFKASDRFREQGTSLVDYAVVIDQGKEKLAKYKEDKAEISIKAIMNAINQPRETVIDMVFDIQWAKSVLNQIN